jgi:hypothetical protein
MDVKGFLVGRIGNPSYGRATATMSFGAVSGDTAFAVIGPRSFKNGGGEHIIRG